MEVNFATLFGLYHLSLKDVPVANHRADTVLTLIVIDYEKPVL